ncbi:uncharacterized protein L969DRAFT_75469 [Mixia osmundae IAM 14324]|uniref:Uncharacterized protein n=1 Tax=Mixia osmundae (strain CBS 9802 / IAM 14324 / JCM 22182 / KY 12970) TaxID=764103 RepID=G7E195_MIXOS|nr:uncharacterized protein L969DRAFT_75469 [Mixia osmundae IAM 14324]KEI38757.1 hypothetical protein L969DRAFT_75469 [Mixia osmundae IAM 14324]GAA96605.1 hypothetical protein E5Q_03275 [Mixia osmundae IAM 14324]
MSDHDPKTEEKKARPKWRPSSLPNFLCFNDAWLPSSNRYPRSIFADGAEKLREAYFGTLKQRIDWVWHADPSHGREVLHKKHLSSAKYPPTLLYYDPRKQSEIERPHCKQAEEIGLIHASRAYTTQASAANTRHVCPRDPRTLVPDALRRSAQETDHRSESRRGSTSSSGDDDDVTDLFLPPSALTPEAAVISAFSKYANALLVAAGIVLSLLALLIAAARAILPPAKAPAKQAERPRLTRTTSPAKAAPAPTEPKSASRSETASPTRRSRPSWTTINGHASMRYSASSASSYQPRQKLPAVLERNEAEQMLQEAGIQHPLQTSSGAMYASTSKPVLSPLLLPTTSEAPVSAKRWGKKRATSTASLELGASPSRSSSENSSETSSLNETTKKACSLSRMFKKRSKAAKAPERPSMVRRLSFCQRCRNLHKSSSACNLAELVSAKLSRRDSMSSSSTAASSYKANRKVAFEVEEDWDTDATSFEDELTPMSKTTQ